MRVYPLDEHLICRCGHEWEDHHRGCVLNKDYFDYPLTIGGCIAQECEYNQFEGYFAPRHGEKTMCKCNQFHPRARNVQRLVDEWVKKHEKDTQRG